MYSTDHEWIRSQNDGVLRVGITDYAQNALGDIVYVQLPDLGATVAAGDSVGEVESTKSVSDILAPVTGTITAINENLDSAAETVNSDPYGDGWMFEIQPDDPAELDSLLDAAAYAETIGEN